VRSTRKGREQRYEFRPDPIREATAYLDRVSQEWDQALARLKAFVED
jgi:hypothetical protein